MVFEVTKVTVSRDASYMVIGYKWNPISIETHELLFSWSLWLAVLLAVSTSTTKTMFLDMAAILQ